MEEVALHGRAWDELVEELQHASATLSRYGQDSRADDLDYILNQIHDQRNNGCDSNGADLGRYEEKMIESTQS